MNISIQPEIFESFPHTTVAIIFASNVTVTPEPFKPLQTLKSPIDIESSQTIQAWREAYRQFGAKPKKYRSSIENLLLMCQAGHLPKINSVVDIYNYISVKHILPAGADDLAHIDGDIQLTKALGKDDGTESFLPLGQTEPQHPRAGEVIYRDNAKVLCRRWNWRECDASKITLNTTDAVFYLEAITPNCLPALELAAKELQTLLQNVAQANCEVFYLDAGHPSITYASSGSV